MPGALRLFRTVGFNPGLLPSGAARREGGLVTPAPQSSPAGAHGFLPPPSLSPPEKFLEPARSLQENRGPAPHGARSPQCGAAGGRQGAVPAEAAGPGERGVASCPGEAVGERGGGERWPRESDPHVGTGTLPGGCSCPGRPGARRGRAGAFPQS